MYKLSSSFNVVMNFIQCTKIAVWKIIYSTVIRLVLWGIYCFYMILPVYTSFSVLSKSHDNWNTVDTFSSVSLHHISRDISYIISIMFENIHYLYWNPTQNVILSFLTFFSIANSIYVYVSICKLCSILTTYCKVCIHWHHWIFQTNTFRNSFSFYTCQ